MRNKNKPDKKKSHTAKAKWYGKGSLDNIYYGDKKWIRKIKVSGQRKTKLHRNTVCDLSKSLLNAFKSIKRD